MKTDRVYNETFTSQRATMTKDAYGQPSIAWANNLSDKKCFVKPISDKKLFKSSGREDYNRLCRLYCKVLDITEDDRISYNSEYYTEFLRTSHKRTC